MFKSIETTDQDDFFDFLRMADISPDQPWLKDHSDDTQSDKTSDALLNPFRDSEKDKGIFS